MTFEQKQELSVTLGMMPADKLARVVGIYCHTHWAARGVGAGECDIEGLSKPVVRTPAWRDARTAFLSQNVLFSLSCVGAPTSRQAGGWLAVAVPTTRRGGGRWRRRGQAPQIWRHWRKCAWGWSHPPLIII